MKIGLKRGRSPEGKVPGIVFQPSKFRGKLAVSFRELNTSLEKTAHSELLIFIGNMRQESIILELISSVVGPKFLRRDTVDGNNPSNSPVELGSLSHKLQGFSTSQLVVSDFWTINSIHLRNKSPSDKPLPKKFSGPKGWVCDTLWKKYPTKTGVRDSDWKMEKAHPWGREYPKFVLESPTWHC